jgi:hypothetical protein
LGDFSKDDDVVYDEIDNAMLKNSIAGARLQGG